MKYPSAAVLAAALLTCSLGAKAEEVKMPALGDKYPKVIHYRYANNFPTNRGEDEAYEFWMRNFGTVMGAELDWRVTEEYPDRIPVIKRVKKEHPEQFIPFYLTGHIGLAGTDLQKQFSSGHWAYYPPVRVLQDIPAEEGETTLKVQIRAAAKPTTGAMIDEDWGGNITEASFGFGGGRGDDICLYSLKEDGTPDWENAEHVNLISMDVKNGTIVVKRGLYGSTPREFTGEVYAAPHIQVTRFQGWRYNFHPESPRDAQGRQAVDVWVEEYAKEVLPGGNAEHLDGLQLDTMVEDMWHGGRGMDLTNDQKPDAPEEMKQFAAGVVYAMKKLQEALKPHGKLLLPDGANRGFAYVNGWEVEGFPGRHDLDWRKYSAEGNRLILSEQLCVEPRFTMVQHKIFNYQLSDLNDEGKMEMLMRDTLPFHLSRAVMAYSTVNDSALTWYSLPPNEEDGSNGVYDEMRMGAEHRLAWLGRPVGDRVYVARAMPNLVSPEQVAKAVESKTSAEGEVSFQLTVEPTAQDLTVFTKIGGEPMQDLRVDVEMPRWVTVTLSGGERYPGYLIPADPAQTKTGYYDEDGSVHYFKPGTRLLTSWVQEYDALTIDEANPKGRAIFWEAESDVPEGGLLDLRAFGNGDFRVVAAPVDADGNAGEFVEIVAPFQQAGPTFFRRSAELDGFGLGGKRAVFRFISHSTAVWAQVAVGRPDAGGSLPAGPVEYSITGFVTPEPREQVFHFNNVPVGTPVALTISVEGEEPIQVASVEAFSAPGNIAREYEHGLVLTNIAPRPYTFDLGKLFPGKNFRRLQATPTQDTEVNNGQPVGATVDLQPIDGLFLVKVTEDAGE